MSASIPKLVPKLRIVQLSEATCCDSQQALVNLLQSLHTEDGCLCLLSLEDVKSQLLITREREQTHQRPWVAFIHGICSHQLERRHLIDPSLLPSCRGIFVTSTATGRKLPDNFPSQVPVCQYRIPVTPAPPTSQFSVEALKINTEKKLLCFEDRSQVFSDLSVPEGWQKYRIRSLCESKERDTSLGNGDSNVVTVDRQPDPKVHQLLSENVVFLNLLDKDESDTLLRCIAHQTPLLVNPTTYALKYLDRQYPLFYDTPGVIDAMHLLHEDRLKEARQYLAKIPQLTEDQFIRDIQQSAIYRLLPIPRSHREGATDSYLQEYDVTILICTYTRPNNLPDILQRLCQQDFQGRFEVFIWNNKKEQHEFVEHIYSEYRDKLDVKLMSSSENYYCIPRLSIASLMQSTVLITCDDDILPEPAYISGFLEKYETYGREAVICSRGHFFKYHQLDEENPERFWSKEERSLKTFYDESHPDCEVHFFHGQCSLIPRKYLSLISTYTLPDPQFGLVDDYWMSFVLSHHLNVTIRKVNMQHMFSFSQSAHDSSAAMSYDPIVREQRVNFYIYHMRQGWPHGNQKERRTTVIDRKTDPDLPEKIVVPDQYSF